jgi:hypothetical protein
MKNSFIHILLLIFFVCFCTSCNKSQRSKFYSFIGFKEQSNKAPYNKNTIEYLDSLNKSCSINNKPQVMTEDERNCIIYYNNGVDIFFSDCKRLLKDKNITTKEKELMSDDVEFFIDKALKYMGSDMIRPSLTNEITNKLNDFNKAIDDFNKHFNLMENKTCANSSSKKIIHHFHDIKIDRNRIIPIDFNNDKEDEKKYDSSPQSQESSINREMSRKKENDRNERGVNKIPVDAETL